MVMKRGGRDIKPKRNQCHNVILVLNPKPSTAPVPKKKIN